MDIFSGVSLGAVTAKWLYGILLVYMQTFFLFIYSKRK